MATAFPAIQPTSRAFRAPQWPVTGLRSQQGMTTLRLWASLPSEGELALGFQNISDDNATLIMAAYESARGPVDNLTLPAIIFNGMSANLLTYINNATINNGLTWHFSASEAPQLQSITCDIASVSVLLTAQLRR